MRSPPCAGEFAFPPSTAWASDVTAVVFEGGAWSHAELRSQIAGWKKELAPYRRVGVLAANRPDTVAMFYACAELGLTLVPFNARLTANELAPLVAAAAPDVVFSDDARVASARVFPKIVPAEDLPFVAQPDDRPLAALFTSGTTGTPSLIVLTQGNFRASARASRANLGASADQRWLLCLPLFHVGGLAMAHRCWEYGATLGVTRSIGRSKVRSRCSVRVDRSAAGQPQPERQPEVGPDICVTRFFC